MSTAELRARYEDIAGAIDHQRAVVFEQRAKLEELKVTMEAVQSQLDSVRYPVLTLPLEITSQIFFYCLSLQPDDELSESRAPLLLLRVCKTWRDIALSTSSLWATLHFDADKLFCASEEFLAYPHRYFETVERHLKTWIDRACGRPLSVTLRGELAYTLGDARFADFIRLVAPQVQYFGIHTMAGVKRIDEMHTQRPLQFPLLRKLTVEFLDDDLNDFGEDSRAFYTAFTDAPQLQKVHILNWAGPLIVSMPWAQLTKYTAQVLDLHSAWMLLTEAVNLIGCTLSITIDHSDIDTLIPFVHSHLRSLTLVENPGGETPYCLIDILQFLTLPALQDLRLDGVMELDPWLSPFLAQVPTQLCKLLFLDLSEMAHLTDLELWNVDKVFFLDFLRQLRNPEEQFLPLIQHISFLDCDFGGTLENSDLELLASALASRQTLCPPNTLANVHSFKLCTRDRINVEDITGLLAGKAASGLDIYVGAEAINYLAQPAILCI